MEKKEVSHWNKKELEALNNAWIGTQVNLPNFWTVVAASVPGKSAEQCQKQWNKRYNTAAAKRDETKKRQETKQKIQKQEKLAKSSPFKLHGRAFHTAKNRGKIRVLVAKTMDGTIQDILDGVISSASESESEHGEAWIEELFHPTLLKLPDRAMTSNSEEESEESVKVAPDAYDKYIARFGGVLWKKNSTTKKNPEETKKHTKNQTISEKELQLLSQVTNKVEKKRYKQQERDALEAKSATWDH